MRSIAAGILVAVSTLAAPAWAQPAQFQSPTGNIHCVSDVYEGIGDVRCDLRNFQSTIRRPADCELEFGGAFTITATGRRGEAMCYGDTIAGSYRVLGYGQSWTGNGITCVSAENGMRCTNRAGHGFHIARGSQRVF